MSNADREIEVIGKLIEATKFGRDGGLDSAAWHRISEYAASLCLENERAAAEVERLEAKRLRDEQAASIPPLAPEPPVRHILGRRRQPAA